MIPRLRLGARMLALLLASAGIPPAYAASAAFATPAAPLDLVLLDEATIDARVIRLADLLDASTAPPLPACVREAELGAAPLVEQALSLSRAALERRLLRSGCAGAVRWGGAQAVRVRRAGQRVAAALLRREAEGFLRERLAARYAHAEVTPSSALPDVAVPKGAVSVKVRGELPPAGQVRIPVWLDLLVDDVLYRSVVAGFDVQARQPAWVARRDLDAGQLVGQDDFVRQELAVEQMRQVPLGTEARLDTVRLHRRIHAGEALTAAHVPAQAAVLRGDRLKLVAGAGAVVVETTAVAMNDAQQGQTLLVRATAGTAPVHARLVGAGMARLEEQ